MVKMAVCLQLGEWFTSGLHSKSAVAIRLLLQECLMYVFIDYHKKIEKRIEFFF